MTAAATQDRGSFGLSAPRLVIAPDTPLGDLLTDTLCLLTSGLAVIDAIGADAMPDTLFAALYLLRQAHFTLDHAQVIAARDQVAGGAK